MRISAELNYYCHSSHQSKERYGDWSKNGSTTLGDVGVIGDDANVFYPAEGWVIPDESTHAYILWMEYSTGDSFGRSNGKGAIIGVFGNADIAKAALKAVEANKDDFSIKVTDDFGREIAMSNPGAGYFESVDSLNLDTVALDASIIRERIKF